MAVAALTDAHGHEEHPTSTGLSSRKMLFWAFLGSECMFFGSLIATYLVYRGRDTTAPHPHDVLNIPPPLLFLLVDNATIREMRELVGGDPVPVGAVCKTTNEGMETLFRVPRFFRRYGRKWNTKTAYIGGLHSAYQYCAAADYAD